MTRVPSLRALAVAALAAAAGACAGAGRYPAIPAPETLPEGSPLLSETLHPGDAWLRHYLMAGDADAALALLEGRGGPRDELLRRLQQGVVLHQAGRWAESNAALEWAEREAEQRVTTSVSRLGGMLVLNDASARYVPPPAEMAMLPYYRMLNYLALGDADAAAVEARKAGAYFGALRDRGAGEPCVGEGLVQYLSGHAFARAGEANDALVSLRQAERAYQACEGAAPPPELGADLYRWAMRAGVGEVAQQAAERYRVPPAAADGDAGELVVLVEHGWVAHRAHADIHVPVFPHELDSLNSGSGGAVTSTVVGVVAHTAANLIEQAEWGDAWEERPEVQIADALDGAYIMKLAWPVYRLESLSAPEVRVVVDGEPYDAPLAGDLSAAVLRRWEAQRAGMLARLVARGVVKYLV
ncbi:MAG TPA: hypothetical protein VFQ45_08805, partial [Longimicrobium sp.]|nr:hypothetical protein [Longimicrobium sp.]